MSEQSYYFLRNFVTMVLEKGLEYCYKHAEHTNPDVDSDMT